MSLQISKSSENYFKNIFEYKVEGISINIRTFYDKDNNPWFVGKDIADILGYKDTDKSIRSHIDDDDKSKINNIQPRYYRGDTKIHPDTQLINESGLYSLVLSSKLPTAKLFKRWVTSEVLPSIRKYGEFKLQEIIKQKDEIIKYKDDKLEMMMKMLENNNIKIDHVIEDNKIIKNKLDNTENILIETKEQLNETKEILTNVEEKLDIATEDRVPQPIKKSKIEQFVILRLGNIEPNTYNYYAIRGQVGNVNRQIKLKQKNIEGVVILLNITYQPNSRNLYIRMKEELSMYMDFDANNFDIKNISEKDFINKIINLNNDKKNL